VVSLHRRARRCCAGRAQSKPASWAQLTLTRRPRTPPG
jgi:hypothetical protein